MKILEESPSRLLSSSAVVLLFGAVALGLLSTQGIAHAASTSVGIAIPLYTYPTDSSWTAVINAKQAYANVPVIAVINPASGPGSAQDSNYVQGIHNLQAAGVRVLGYVDTAYSADSLTSVEANVNLYKSWYGVNGIFFDDMSNLATTSSYYSSLDSYVHSAIPGSTTLGNPGTTVPTALIGSLDILNIYEGGSYPALSSITFPGYPTSDFSMIAYGVPLNTTFLGSVTGSVAWVYATDATLPNPYDVLPSYFTSEVAYLSSIDGSTSTATTATSTAASVSVSSVDLSGNPISGMWTTWNQNGVVLASGYTPTTFTGTIGGSYVATVANYGNTVFCHWQDGTTNPAKSLTLGGNVALTAYYSTTGSCPSLAPATFAISVESETTTGVLVTGLYVTVLQNGTPFATGYTTLSFTATSGDTYAITAANYGSYTFSQWSTGSTNPTITVTPSQAMTLIAYYSVTSTTTSHHHHG